MPKDKKTKQTNIVVNINKKNPAHGYIDYSDSGDNETYSKLLSISDGNKIIHLDGEDIEKFRKIIKSLPK